MLGTIQGFDSRGIAWGDLGEGKRGIGNALNVREVRPARPAGSHRSHAESLALRSPELIIVADNKREKHPTPLKHPAVRMAQVSNPN